jgi:hypothetical protein
MEVALDRAKEASAKVKGSDRQGQGGLCQGYKVALFKAKEDSARVTGWQ